MEGGVVRKAFRLLNLRTELLLRVFSLLKVETTLEDWIAVEQTSRAFRENGVILFANWLGEQAVGSEFGYYSGSAREVGFL
jgi:hypothetical protein